MKCILHIGPPKTGSTSIQLFLRDNRERLRHSGIFVPQTQKPTQQEFALLTLDEFDESRPRIRLGIRNLRELRERQAQIRPDLERQMDDARRSCRLRERRAATREHHVATTRSLPACERQPAAGASAPHAKPRAPSGRSRRAPPPTQPAPTRAPRWHRAVRARLQSPAPALPPQRRLPPTPHDDDAGADARGARARWPWLPPLSPPSLPRTRTD